MIVLLPPDKPGSASPPPPPPSRPPPPPPAAAGLLPSSCCWNSSCCCSRRCSNDCCSCSTASSLARCAACAREKRCRSSIFQFLAFVCPEPVLAKDRFSPENGAQGAISAPVALECACRQLTQRQSISTIALTFTHHSSGVCRGNSGNSKVFPVEKGRMWFFFF
jgi:hypothetical protein